MTRKLGRIAAILGVGIVAVAVLAGGCAKKTEVPSRSPIVPPPPPKKATEAVEAAGPRPLTIGELHAAVLGSRIMES